MQVFHGAVRPPVSDGAAGRAVRQRQPLVAPPAAPGQGPGCRGGELLPGPWILDGGVRDTGCRPMPRRKLQTGGSHAKVQLERRRAVFSAQDASVCSALV